jgi:hypothetical protein
MEVLRHLVKQDRDEPPLVRFVNSIFFKGLSVLAIAANTVYIGFRTDQQVKNSYLRVEQRREVDEERMPPGDLIFIIWFTLEIGFNVAAKGTDFFLGKDWRWNWFDIVLIVNAVIELGWPEIFTNLSFLRICRVLRLIRVVRLVRTVKALRSLRTMIFSMISSLACLLWAFVMIGLVTFIFSIVFGNAVSAFFEEVDVSNAAEVETALRLHKTFGSVYASTVSLYSAITGGNDWMAYGEQLQDLDSNHFYFVLFMFYIGFCLVGMLNVVTGIFVDSAVCTRTEDEVVDSYTEDLERTSDEVRRIFKEADIDKSGLLTQEEFINHLADNAWVAAYFSGMQIDTSDAATIFTLMDADCSGDLTVDEFVEGTMKLKGGARSIDIFSMMFDHARLAAQVNKLSSLTEEYLVALYERLIPRSSDEPTRRIFPTVDETLRELEALETNPVAEIRRARRAELGAHEQS